MRRVALENRAQKDKFGVSKHGFTPGNPSTGVLATIPGAEWFDSVQEEIANTIEAAGFSLDTAKSNQLHAAILKLIGNATISVANTLASNSSTDALSAQMGQKLQNEKLPYSGATKAVNLNGQQLQNTGDIRLGNGANNSYQAVMLGNYERTLADENYNVLHNSRYVPDTLLRFTAISTFSAQGAHISSIFASDKDAILRLGETNYLIALKNEVANKSVKIDSGTGLLGGGDLTANRTLRIDKASVADVNNSTADKVVTADILLPFLSARVVDTRTINSGTGLLGGGDLTANRTISIDKATTQNVNLGDPNKVVTADVLLPFLSARVADTRSIGTGTGLTGGGDLSANRTLAIDKASLAEINAGTANKVVCADALQQAFANTKNENGYTKLPNGIVLQWGKHAVFEETKAIATYAAVFPISFPNACLNISLSKIDAGGGDVFNILSSPAPTKTGFSFGVSDKGANPITGGHMFWWAIGY